MSEATPSATQATVPQAGAKGASKAGKSTKKATPKKEAPKAKKPAKKQATPKAKAAAREGTQREGSKKAVIYDLLSRPKGATLGELMTAAGWQAHSVRGFISTTGKKHGNIESSKNEAGERVYRMTK